MTNLKNKTIQSTILILIICLIAGYIYYDFQRYQALEKEFGKGITALERQLAGLRKEAMGVGASSLVEPEATEFTKLRGIIKKIEDGIIILQAVVVHPNEETLPDFSESKEYQVVVDSKTSIQKQNQEINLADLKQGKENGDPVIVIGQANPFNKREVAAETIFVLRE